MSQLQVVQVLVQPCPCRTALTTSTPALTHAHLEVAVRQLHAV